MKYLLISAVLMLLPLPAVGSPVPRGRLPPERLTVMADRILAASDGADLVCLGENHGSVADAALRIALVEHPDFPDAIDVVVLESASSIHQARLDRFFLDGEEMSREELRPTWRDAGRGVVWELPIYEDFLRALRRVNLGLPRPRRVRVIGGAVAIPWHEVKAAKDLLPFLDREDRLRRLVQREVLDRELRALLIFGSFHCEKKGTSFAASLHTASPGRLWSAFAFSGEEGVSEGKARLGLGDEPRLIEIAGTPHAAKKAKAAFFEGHVYSGVRFGELLDAVVYYGAFPDEVLTVDENDLEPALRREVKRRDRLRHEAARLAGGG